MYLGSHSMLSQWARVTSTPDRQEIVAQIDGTQIDGAQIDGAQIDGDMAAGACQAAVCAELGLNARTRQRWTGPQGAVCDDHRPFAEHPEPAGKLSDVERDRIVAICNTPEFASLPPSQIVPRLADQGVWIASESSSYRVLRERSQNHRRAAPARPRVASRPPASRPRRPARSGETALHRHI
jgi:hypothetical protein